jgi:type I restriction enzyme, S subunit
MDNNKTIINNSPVGKIPDNWDIIELKKACNKITDGTHDTPTPTQDGVPFLTAIHVKEDLIDFDNCYFLPNEIHNEIYRRCNPEKDDVLMVNIGAGVGTTALVTVDYQFSLKNVALLKPNTKMLIGSYLNFYQVFFKPKLTQSLLNGGAQPFLSLKQIQKLKIVLPPLPEQKAIARLLSTWDDAISKNQALIAQKELRKKWLMQNLLTGKKRIKGYGGEWKVHSYEKLLKIVKRNFEWDENTLYKLISVRRRSGGIFHREALYGHHILVKTLRTANEGDFLFSKMQILHGASALVTKEFDGAKISGSYIAVVAKDGKLLNMEFLKWYSQTPYFYHQTFISSYGVHIEKMTFDFGTFLQLEIRLPGIEEQIAINEVLQTADKEIQLLKAKTEKLREQKKGLMQVLLTGKKRLIIN